MLANYPNYGLLAAIIAACPRQALKEFHAKTPNMFSHLFEKHRPLPKTPAMADLMRALDLLVDCFSFTAAGVPNGNPLHKVAAQMLKAEVVKEIAEKYKLSLLHRDDKGNTLLHAAVASQRDEYGGSSGKLIFNS